MPQGRDYVSFILEDKDKILNFIAQVSDEMFQYINSKPSSRYILFYKYLTHSDLGTFGKATRPNSHDKNLLYYLREEEMKEIEEKTHRPFQTAHQSCIGLKKQLYNLVGLPQPRDNDPYLINNYMNVKLVNSSLDYFKSLYTKKIFDILGKHISTNSTPNWNFNNLDLNLSKDNFTTIPLHVAVHGLGMAEDEEFHKLRHHMFKGDTFILLFEIGLEKNMFILNEKNPSFFSILGESNKAYENYQKKLRDKLINEALNKENASDSSEDEITRQQQQAWRKMLANEMMGYTAVDGQVFCPFTFITADFENLSPLFVASHIKGFSDPNTTNDEKYDINNGLLLCSNADSLFDKHLISVNENKELVFSFLFDNDNRLKQQLLLLQPIFKPILNEKRMKYLKYHYDVFKKLEAERRVA